MSKKAQGLSMNTIIIAAIALLVLVILATLVLNAGGNVVDQTGCKGINSNAYCEDPGYCQDGYIESGQKDCPDGDICCIPF